MYPWMHVCIIISMYIHCINKITNLLVSTVARNSGNCNLIGHVGHICNYNHILFCLIDVQRSRMSILIESL